MLRYRFKNTNITKNSDWVKKTLEQCCNCYDSQRIPVSEKNRVKGMYPYYGANGVQDYINDYIFDGEYILLAEDGGHYTEFRTRPIAQFVTGKFWVNNHAHILQAKDEFNNKFIFYCLEHKNIIPDVKGSTRGKLNKSDMWRINISIPSNVKEQQKIADFLSAVDNQIEIQRQRVDVLELQKKGLLDKVFSQELRFKKDNESDFSDWKKMTLEQCCNCYDSQRIPVSEKNRVKGIYPYYGANGVQDYINDYIFDGEYILLAEDGGHYTEFRTRPIAQFITGKFWVNNHAHILQAKDEFNNKFIFYCLEHKNIIPDVKGSTRGKLNKSDMWRIKISIPSNVKEQQKIADFFTAIDNQINIEKQRLNTMETIKKGLLQQMFM